MPLDPSIIMAGMRNQDLGSDIMQGMQFGQQMAAQRQQMQARQAALDEAERQRQEQATVSSVLARAGGDRQAALRELRLRSMGGAAQDQEMAWGKYDLEQAKMQRENAKADLENRIKMEEFKKLASQRVVAAVRRGDSQAAQRHWSESGMPGQFDPGMAWDVYRGSVSALDEMKNDWDREQFGVKQDETKAKIGLEEKKFQADQAESKQRIAQGWKGLSLREQQMKDDKETASKPAQPKTKGNPQEVDNLLKQAEEILPNATGSYAGAAKELIARGWGASTEAGKANQSLKAIEAAIMMNMPRMEGPQSDKDVALYRQMAGQLSDTTLPIETRKAAIQTIRDIAQRQSGMAQPRQSQTQGVATVKDDADYDKLTPGTRYKGPDGIVRVK